MRRPHLPARGGRPALPDQRSVGHDGRDYGSDRRERALSILACSHLSRRCEKRFGHRSLGTRRREDRIADRISRCFGENRRTARSRRNAAARYDGHRRTCRGPLAEVPRTALRLFVPARKRKDVLQRTGLGELPRQTRRETFSRPSDEFPRFGGAPAGLLAKAVRKTGRTRPRRRDRHQPGRSIERLAAARNTPLFLTSARRCPQSGVPELSADTAAAPMHQERSPPLAHAATRPPAAPPHGHMILSWRGRLPHVCRTSASRDPFDRDVGVGPQHVEKTVAVVGRAGLYDERGTIEAPFGIPVGRNFERENGVGSRLQLIEHGTDPLFSGCGKDHERAPQTQPAEDQRQPFERNEGQHGRGSGHGIHPRADRQTDSGRGP